MGLTPHARLKEVRKMRQQTRRDFHKTLAAGAGASLLTTPGFANDQPQHPRGKAEHVISIWLGGGAAQIDTFDPKRVSKDGLKDPGSAYPAIDTAIEGVQVCEHLKTLAPLMDRCVPVRTVHHDVIDEHAAAGYRMHTGRPTSGTIQYPSIGSLVSYTKEPLNDLVPSYVLMGNPSPSRGPGFLGAEHGYVYLAETKTGPKGLARPERISEQRDARRRKLLDQLRDQYVAKHPDESMIADYVTASEKGFRLAGPEFMNVFQLENEPSSLRERYGDEFGQRCLLARRLIERGTRFVEVSFNLNFKNGTGWDTHREGQQGQHLLIQSLDQAFSTLLMDLEEKRMLDKTLLVISSEFGRPAGFDNQGGRNHHGACFTVTLAGGGLRTGQAVGETDELAMNVASNPVSVPDLFATIVATLGVNPSEELYAGERPVPLTDRGVPVGKLFA